MRLQNQHRERSTRDRRSPRSRRGCRVRGRPLRARRDRLPVGSGDSCRRDKGGRRISGAGGRGLETRVSSRPALRPQGGHRVRQGPLSTQKTVGIESSEGTRGGHQSAPVNLPPSSTGTCRLAGSPPAAEEAEEEPQRHEPESQEDETTVHMGLVLGGRVALRHPVGPGRRDRAGWNRTVRRGKGRTTARPYWQGEPKDQAEHRQSGTRPQVPTRKTLLVRHRPSRSHRPECEPTLCFYWLPIFPDPRQVGNRLVGLLGLEPRTKGL